MKIVEFKDFDLLKIGNELEITAVTYGREGEQVVIMLPDEGESIFDNTIMIIPTLEEWQQIVRQSDLKEIEGMEKGQKIILRKSTRQIETKIMWEVFRKDNYTCRYCGADDRPLTVDHIVLWENMGPSIALNLITSCKKCNNARGNMQYEDWLKSPYYLGKIPQLTVDVIAENVRVLAVIPSIEHHHLRNVKRSR